MERKKKPKQMANTRLLYEQKQRLAELEERLCGAGAPILTAFGKEDEQNAARLPNGAYQAIGGEGEQLVVWEDRQAGGDQLTDSDAASEGSEESADPLEAAEPPGQQTDSDDEEAVEAEAGTSAAARAPSSDADDEERRDSDALAKRRASGAAAGSAGKRKAVWEDPDEEALQIDIAAVNRLRKLRTTESEAVVSGPEYSKRLKKQHVKLHPRTSWAALGKGRPKKAEGSLTDEADEEDILERVRQGAGSLLGRSLALPSGPIEITRVKDANVSEPGRAVVQSVEFHAGGRLLMTAGLDKRLNFFQVDGIKNPKVQSVFLSDLPIHRAAFADSGSKVIASGRRKHFYVLDLESARVERVSHLSGRSERSLERFAVSPDPARPLVAFLGAQGGVPLVSWRSRQLVGSLRMSGSVRSAAFADDGTYLMASGGDGIVHTWDLRMQRCISRFVDEGALQGISLASSPGQRYLAAGSDAGFVNIYDQKAAILAGTAPSNTLRKAAIVAPKKTLKNLTTAVDNLCFSPDGQILAVSSRAKKDALRLVHTASMTVFPNWPTSRTPLGLAACAAFSPGGGFFAVGNAKGRVLLYRLHHYAQA